MKAYELLDNTPNEINGFKKEPNQYSKEDYSFELNSEEETSFYQTLEVGWDENQFLWFENDKKAYSLYVTLNDDREVEFRYYYMIILWTNESGETEYDTLDEDLLFAKTFEEAVTEFLKIFK